MKVVKSLLIILFLIGFCSSVFAEGMGWKWNRMEHLEWMSKKLDLKEEQRKEIEEIYQKTNSKIKELQTSIQTKRQELLKLMKEDVPDLAKIKSILEELSKLKIDLRMQLIEDRIKVQEILNPEQKVKHKEWLEKRFLKMKEKFGKHGKFHDCD